MAASEGGSETLQADLPAPGSDPWLAERLAHWLATRTPQAERMVVSDLVEPAQGHSSKTVLFKASWTEQGVATERQLVARIGRDNGCPMLADILHQYRVMQAIAAHSDVAVPSLGAAETDSAVLGAPFFLMDRVVGRVPPDFPSYHAEGWFAEALTPAERNRAWWNGVREMERLHRIGWRAFPFLAGEGAPDSGAPFYLHGFVQGWMDWAAEGQPYPLIEAALARLVADAPPPGHVGLVWNDARLGNTMFGADLGVSSLFDFEVATLGPAEIDLAWWLYMEELFSSFSPTGRLDGIPDRDEAIRGFEQIYGRSMPDFAYFDTIAALKHAAISLREYGNGKVAFVPKTLPPIAVERLERYLGQRT